MSDGFLYALANYIEIRAEVKEKEANVEYDRSYFLADEYAQLERAEQRLLDQLDARIAAKLQEFSASVFG